MTVYSDKIIGSGLSSGGVRSVASAYVSATTNTTVTICWWGGMQSILIDGYAYTSSTTFNGKTISNSGSTSYSGDWISPYATGNQYTTITRTHSSQTATCTSSVTISGGTGTCSESVSIPAKPSYTLTYNANGGSNAPSSQTIWYNETATVSSSKPTRTNYNFLGWSTSKTATSATYTAGATIAASAITKSITLYAVWQLAYKKPTVSFVSATRVASASSAISDLDSTYVLAKFTWTCDSSKTATLTPSSTNKCTIGTGTGATTATTYTAASGTTSGTVYVRTTVPLTSNTAIKLTINDTKTTVSTSGATPTASYPIDICHSGTGDSVALLGVAPSATGTIKFGQYSLTNAPSGSVISRPFDVLSCRGHGVRYTENFTLSTSGESSTTTFVTRVTPDSGATTGLVNYPYSGSQFALGIKDNGSVYPKLNGIYLVTYGLSCNAVGAGSWIEAVVRLSATSSSTPTYYPTTTEITVPFTTANLGQFSQVVYARNTDISTPQCFTFCALNGTSKAGKITFIKPAIIYLGY
jgi:uncharacterized repeat protein (TIGR02543 family)